MVTSRSREGQTNVGLKMLLLLVCLLLKILWERWLTRMLMLMFHS